MGEKPDPRVIIGRTSNCPGMREAVRGIEAEDRERKRPGRLCIERESVTGSLRLGGLGEGNSEGEGG